MHRREPVKDTCPLIDKCIEQIKAVINNSVDVSYSRDVDTMEEWISNTVLLLDKIIEAFEELRDSNVKLRDWGCNEASRVDKLEEKIEEYDVTTIGISLQREIDYLLDLQTSTHPVLKDVTEAIVEKIADKIREGLDDLIETELPYLELNSDDVKKIYFKYINNDNVWEIADKVMRDWGREATIENITTYFVIDWYRQHKNMLKKLIAYTFITRFIFITEEYLCSKYMKK